ncbi:unnamed protein product [Dovyalis caffra]|uniref:RRM domain-containing protein n=1 Tax=Dovyalis caffra TaxID=77055 RepID=A0AAV1RHX9_9ROSI|nr:unnamed protein product [Dovyalis caffra]
MVQSDLTVQVLNLSPSVTRIELNTFFSYCGTVEKIELHKDNDQLQFALVTFTQPYAFQTALLLNDAFLGGRPIRILPAQDIEIPITGPDIRKNHGSFRIVPAVQAAIQAVALKSIEMLSKTTELEENYKLSEKGRILANQTRSTICDAEQAAESYVSAGAMWLSGALDKTSKRVSALGTMKGNGPNSRNKKWA